MPQNTAITTIVDQSLRVINDADAVAATQRVQELRAQKQQLDNAALIEQLIKQKTIQTGIVGAVTSGAGLIPGLGSLAAFTLGVATDIGVTMKLQTELMLEIAAVHGHELTPDQRRTAVVMVTGVNVGAERLVNQAGRRLAEKTAERFAGRAIVKAIPFVGIAVSAGANMVTTYVIGRRADAYFGLGPEAVGDWNQSLRAITGVDERKLGQWLGEVMSVFGAAALAGAQRAGQAAGAFVQWAGGALQARLRREP
jgi:uncharacterized protein (DUF697 family)